VAKAFINLGLKQHHAVNIIGFNAPEWHIRKPQQSFFKRFSQKSEMFTLFQVCMLNKFA